MNFDEDRGMSSMDSADRFRPSRDAFLRNRPKTAVTPELARMLREHRD
jgi:hypothetical protein